jgi:uncharacterized membrane protein
LERSSKLGALVRGAISVALASGAIGWIVSISTSSSDVAMGVLALFAYLVAGYVIALRPDYDDVGWLGGLVNNPFRLTDNFNRWLVFLNAVLLPGRFVSTGIRDLVNVARGRRVIALPPRDGER